MPLATDILTDRYGAFDVVAAGNNATGSTSPAVARIASAGFVTAFYDGNGIVAQRYDIDGVPAGSQVRVAAGVSATDAAVTGLSTGGYAISYTAPDASDLGVFVRLYDAAGQQVGSEVALAAVTTGSQRQSSLTALAGNRFLATWTDGSSGVDDVKARIFDAVGAPQGGEFVISNTPNSASVNSAVAALVGGGFVVSWNEANGNTASVVTQVYGPNNAPLGAPITLSSLAGSAPMVAALPNGDFVLVSSGDFQGGVTGGVYTATGTPVGPRFGTGSSLGQSLPQAVAALDGGGFAIASSSFDSSGGTFTIFRLFVSRYDAGGNFLGNFLASNPPFAVNTAPALTAFGTDDFVLAWNAQMAGRPDPRPAGQLSVREFFNVTNGTLANDALTGTGGVDWLRGFAGEDRLVGTGARDVLDGAFGVDTMIGGAGDDSYFVDNPNDSVIENAGEGVDTIYTSTSYTLSPSSDVETVVTSGASAPVTLVGSLTGNRLTGTFGDDVLIGYGSVDTPGDTLVGSGGNDVYLVQNQRDVVIEIGEEGRADTLYAVNNYTLSADAVIENFAAATAISSVGLTLGGNRFGQAIAGTFGNDTIQGGGGAVNGGDILIGLRGDDSYLVDAVNILLIEANGEGNDTATVLAAGSGFVLNGDSFVETLRAEAGTAAINITGSLLSQALIGNDGDNILSTGGGGADTLDGGLGNDIYRVHTSVQIADNGGTDILYTSGSFRLFSGAGIEALSTAVQSGTEAIDITGNDIAQTVVGNFGNNVLDGRSGDDTLIGLGGADLFAFTRAGGPGNVDTIQDFVSGTDRIGLANNLFLAVVTDGITAGEFVNGTAAVDGDDRLLYDQASGRLFYDADANGAGAAVLFAQLGAGTALTAADFIAVGTVV